MDLEKEQNIKSKLEAIKEEENETLEVKSRKLRSLINQMNLRLLENPEEKKTILNLQKLGYEAILSLVENDKELKEEEKEIQKDRTNSILIVIKDELGTL